MPMKLIATSLADSELHGQNLESLVFSPRFGTRRAYATITITMTNCEPAMQLLSPLLQRDLSLNACAGLAGAWMLLVDGAIVGSCSTYAVSLSVRFFIKRCNSHCDAQLVVACHEAENLLDWNQ